MIGGKKRKCTSMKKKKSCTPMKKCSWSKSSKKGAKGHCRKSKNSKRKGSKRRSSKRRRK